MTGPKKTLTVERFAEHLEHEWERPLGGDPLMRAFSGGLLDSLEDEEVQQTLDSVFQARHGQGVEFTPQYAANLAERLVQWCIIKDPEIPHPSFTSAFDERFRERDAWREFIQNRIFTEGGSDHFGDFLFGMYARDLVSNNHRRYVSVPLVRCLLADMFPTLPKNIIDAGASDNQGGKAIIKNGPWHNLEFIDPEIDVTAMDQPLMSDPQLTDAGRRILSSPVEGMEVTGMDYWDERTDPEILEWRLVSSHYPSEWTPENIEDYKRRRDEPVQGARFVQADIAEEGLDLTECTGYADMVLVFTVAYQLSEADRKATIENAMRHGRYVFVQDHMELDPEDPTQLVNVEEWNMQPLPYVLYMLDSESPQEGFRPLLRYDGGRCSRVQLCNNELGRFMLEKLRQSSA